MRDLLGWNLSLGRLFGVRVYLHVLFLLCGVFAWQQSVAADPDLGWYAAGAMAVLLASVLAHELGHALSARRLGGRADEIHLWPLGGLAPVRVPHEPHAELITAAAGPLVNFGVCCVCAPVLAWIQTPLGEICNPLRPPTPAGAVGLLDVLKLVFWTNWVLGLMNLLPAEPLDGGRVLRALFWQQLGFRTAVVRVRHVASVVALLLCLTGVWVQSSYPFALLPLVLLGVFVHFSAKQDLDRLRGHDPRQRKSDFEFAAALSGLPVGTKTAAPPKPGPVRQWLDERREAKVALQRRQAEEDDQKVDEILARVHASGLAGLSPEERALLDRVSARLRERQRS